MDEITNFKPVPTWTPQEVRKFIATAEDSDYNLVDVRQPAEYENGHIPGALLIPVGELPGRVSELDPSRTTIVYCASGVRSASATSIMERAGFHEVYNMAGGIRAWKGLVAMGFPESALELFDPARSIGEWIDIAWNLEEGTRLFYEKMAEMPIDSGIARLFGELAASEDHHKEVLSAMYWEISGEAGLPQVSTEPAIMEGGLSLDQVVSWSVDKDASVILEFAVALEARSYDRYLFLGEEVSDSTSRRLFTKLAAEEKHHLDRLTASFEEYLAHP